MDFLLQLMTILGISFFPMFGYFAEGDGGGGESGAGGEGGDESGSQGDGEGKPAEDESGDKPAEGDEAGEEAEGGDSDKKGRAGDKIRSLKAELNDYRTKHDTLNENFKRAVQYIQANQQHIKNWDDLSSAINADPVKAQQIILEMMSKQRVTEDENLTESEKKLFDFQKQSTQDLTSLKDEQEKLRKTNDSLIYSLNVDKALNDPEISKSITPEDTEEAKESIFNYFQKNPDASWKDPSDVLKAAKNFVQNEAAKEKRYRKKWETEATAAKTKPPPKIPGVGDVKDTEFDPSKIKKSDGKGFDGDWFKQHNAELANALFPES